MFSNARGFVDLQGSPLKPDQMLIFFWTPRVHGAMFYLVLVGKNTGFWQELYSKRMLISYEVVENMLHRIFEINKAVLPEEVFIAYDALLTRLAELYADVQIIA